KFAGMTGLLAIPEVADVRALIDVAVDATRGEAAARLLTRLRLGIRDIQILAKWAKQSLPEGDFTANLAETLTNLPPADFCIEDDPHKVLSPAARERLEQLREAIIAVRSACARPLPDIIAVAERALGIDIDVLARPDARGVSARRYLDQFRLIARNFVPISPTPAPLDDFVSWLQMVDQAGEDLSGNVGAHLDSDRDDAAVELLTMHTAKGLEFTHVIVAGMSDAEFPTNNYRGKLEISDSAWLTATDMLPFQLRKDASALPELLGPAPDSPIWHSPPDHPLVAYLGETNAAKLLSGYKRAAGFYRLNEERRLAYVAFTRAEQTLVLTAPRAVTSTSNPLALSQRRISRFIAEHFDEDDPHRLIGPDTTTTATKKQAWIAAPPQSPTVSRAPLVGAFGTLELPNELAPWEELAERLASQSDNSQQIPTYPASLYDEERATALAPLAERIRQFASLDAQARQELLQQSVAQSGAQPWSLQLLWQESELLLQELQRDDAHEIYVPERMSATGAQHAASNPQQYLEYLRRPLPSEPVAAARLGTEFHKWVEDYYTTRSQQLFVEPHADADTAAAITSWQRRFLASRFADKTPVATETPATLTIVRDGSPLRIDCKIDAVFVVDGRHLIVDWKTGRAPRNEQEWQLRALQLQLYRHAYGQTHEIDVELIDALLYYVASDTEFVAPALTRAEIAERLAHIDDSVVHEVLNPNLED
ncbi:MAG: 3'-5' exonuclease, partial [Bowdeniella nasicola]|nr:3'-5' exonuclease [Bowdeniella nasicola]